MTGWPEGVVARYLTVGGATVDVADTGELSRYGGLERAVSAHCTGGGCAQMFTGMSLGWYGDQDRPVERFEASLLQLNTAAQAHAEICRAMPRPGGGPR